MNIVRLATRQLLARPLHSALNVILLALGIATITLLMLFSAQLSDKLLRNGEGIDLVVGAKGSPLQLIMSTVYHADIPTGNIAKRDADKLARHPLVARAVPLALGDNLAGFRIVGTTHDYLALYGGQLASGQPWSVSMEAVLGANVARTTGLKLGDNVSSSHGLGTGGHAHDDNLYQIVGILAPTGTILDELVLTDLQSVWDLHEDHGSTNPALQGADAHAGHAENDENGKPRDITALLIQYKTPLAVLALPRQINANTPMQAASPAMESVRLLNIVGFGLDAFRAFAAILVISAGLSLFVALYTTLKERRYDLALMRLLGSSRARLFSAVLIEGLLIAGFSAVLGLALGHGVAELAGQLKLTPGITLTGARWVAEEGWLVLLALGVGLLASLLPAWQAWRADIALILSER
ncbi:ABC transporter permease [Chitinimonas sp. BJYL2]|uniref:ABC transporter permease n=1 Tax=Chitinimonas sp. BJYL2 TaxID=2976696 RepID=UPI0022B53566|nr:ABC transporter permease [Chitinimonas sp. BJYL2]